MAKLTLVTAKKMYLEGGAGKDFALDNFSEDELKGLLKTWDELGVTVPNWVWDASDKYINFWQLEQLMKAYNGDWVADWNDDSYKWCVYFVEEKIKLASWSLSRRFLAFKSKDLAEQFLENFKDLIETAKPLL